MPRPKLLYAIHGTPVGSTYLNRVWGFPARSDDTRVRAVARFAGTASQRPVTGLQLGTCRAFVTVILEGLAVNETPLEGAPGLGEWAWPNRG